LAFSVSSGRLLGRDRSGGGSALGRRARSFVTRSIAAASASALADAVARSRAPSRLT
jgi:hypothetical protein